MKRIYLFLLTLCLVSIYSLPTRAGVFDQDEEYALTLWGWHNGIYYDGGSFTEVYVSNTTGNWSWATIWIDQEDNYPNLSGNIDIPAEVYLGGPVFKQKVVGIRRNAFRNMRPAVSIQLPSTVKAIGDQAFYNATGLEKLYMRTSVDTIGYEVFYGCTNLRHISLSPRLRNIPYSTFMGCTSLRLLNLPNVDCIGDKAFDGCSSLQRIYFDSNDFITAKKIGKYAFASCTDLRMMKFPYVTTIGDYAFINCKKLKEIVLPTTLTSIGRYAFANTGLQVVTNRSLSPQLIEANVFDDLNLSKCILFVQKGYKEVYQNAPIWKNFGQILEEGDRPAIAETQKIGDLYYELHEDMTATVLKHDDNDNISGALVIPATVSINKYGFKYTFTVNKMENEAFRYCTNLTSVELPMTFDEIPTSAFLGCSGLTKVTIPSSISKIGNTAFYSCSALESLPLPYALEEIGASAFGGCKSLTSVTIPAGVEILPEGCFTQCTNLSSVTLPEGLTEIQRMAFNYCPALTSITLPESVTTLGEYAVATNGLTTLRSLNPTPPTATDATFGSVPSSGCVLYVPVGSKEAYQTAPGWKLFTDIREKGENKRIKYGDLYYYLKEDFTAIVSSEESEGRNNYPYLEGEVTVADKVLYEGREYKVNSVGEDAFMNASKVTKVNLPSTIEKIWSGAFWGSGLTEINIPSTVTLLASSAFQNTPLYDANQAADGSVYYDGCLLDVPNNFYGHYEVKEGTRIIASYVFEQMPDLTGITLPEGLMRICNGAIDNLSLVQAINLPATINYIGEGFLSSTCPYLYRIDSDIERPYQFPSDNYFKGWTKEQLAQITLYVPFGSRSAYAQAEIWKDFNIVERDPIYTVTFVDYDGAELDVQRVKRGEDAAERVQPGREGYDFTGWDKDFTNVQSDLTVTAQYSLACYTVQFRDGVTDDVIDTQEVYYGYSARAPEAPKHDGFIFIGWDKPYTAISANTVVYAQYLHADGVVVTKYSPQNRELTYYYLSYFDESAWTINELYIPGSVEPRFEGYHSQVERITIDGSMKNAPITSMSNLFFGGMVPSDDGFEMLALDHVTSIYGLDNLNTSIVTDMTTMFFGLASMKELDLTSFDTRNVTNMSYMFSYCVNLQKVDVSSFDISNVTHMERMFGDCVSLTTIVCPNDWSTTEALSTGMFYNCTNLVGDKGTTFDREEDDATYARPDGGTDAPGYFTERINKVYTEFVEATGTLTYYYDDKMDTRPGVTEAYIIGATRFLDYYDKVRKVVIDPSMKKSHMTTMQDFFDGGFDAESFTLLYLKNVTSIEGLENLNTSIVTNMNSMFSGLESLTELDLSSFDTRNVTNTAYMFAFSTGLKYVDLNSFDISNVTTMNLMFAGCTELTTICCSNDWSTTEASNTMMFFNCKKLVGGQGTVYDSNMEGKTYARPDGGASAPGYFTADTMTGIKGLNGSEAKGDIYNLAGQRLNKPAKGINIIGGQKVLVK